MLIPPHRHSRGNGAKEPHPSYFIHRDYLKSSKNKVLFLVLLGIALLFYGAALAYMK